MKDFFGIKVEDSWEKEWQGMPEFNQGEIKPFHSISIRFKKKEDREEFLKLLGYKPERRMFVWYPKRDFSWKSLLAYKNGISQNKYPIYIISKGRWGSRITSRELDKLGILYSIVIEPQEYEQYAAVIDPKKILVLPFSNLGQGSIPARNWVWEHAISTGAERHWILDDNIQGFYLLNNNAKIKVVDFNPFILSEQFTDRYENVAISGMHYEFFLDRFSRHPPYLLNTRVYSCLLIKNDLPYRWRGRYNEDTDLSLRVLKDGWCTILFNIVLAKKVTTMKMKGGNTDELYKEDGRLKMAYSLRAQHPDVVKVTYKWGRPQHHVDYSRFRQQLKLKEGGLKP